MFELSSAIAAYLLALFCAPVSRLMLDRADWHASASSEAGGRDTRPGGRHVRVIQRDRRILIGTVLRAGVQVDVGKIAIDQIGSAIASDQSVRAGDGRSRDDPIQIGRAHV